MPMQDYAVVIPCERCERRPCVEVRGEELLCEDCAQTLDEIANEAAVEQYHAGGWGPDETRQIERLRDAGRMR